MTARVVKAFTYTSEDISIKLRVNQEWKYHSSNGRVVIRRDNVRALMDLQTFSNYFEDIKK